MCAKSIWVLAVTLLVLQCYLTKANVLPEARIVGGSEVDVERYPFIVSIRYRNPQAEGYYHECAGAIYTERVVITGAQCIRGLVESDKVLIVAKAKTRRGSDGMFYPAAKWVHHPSYDMYTVDYDIGLFLLDIPFGFSRNEISAIPISESRPAANRSATIAGWGYLAEGGPSSAVLEAAQVPIVSDEDCTRSYGAGEITERMICAGDLAKGGRDACQGDTGGPLIVNSTLVGLVSWGRGCGRVNYPTVYTYVPALKQWIDDTIAANNF